jgi:hypothetical protein
MNAMQPFAGQMVIMSCIPMIALKYVVVLALWILFLLAIFCGFLFGLLALPFNSGYTSRNLRAHDRAAAAFLGWSGDRTVSKECAQSNCRFCKILCAILSVVLEPEHCKRQPD